MEAEAGTWGAGYPTGERKVAHATRHSGKRQWEVQPLWRLRWIADWEHPRRWVAPVVGWHAYYAQSRFLANTASNLIIAIQVQEFLAAASSTREEVEPDDEDYFWVAQIRHCGHDRRSPKWTHSFLSAVEAVATGWTPPTPAGPGWVGDFDPSATRRDVHVAAGASAFQ